MAYINKWEKLESKIVLESKIFKIRQDTSVSPRNGTKHNFFVMESADWVNVIPITEDNKIVLIRQYRAGIEDTILEIPGGIVNEGETPENAALRELREETGTVPEKLVYLGKVHPNPAIQANYCYSFLALGVKHLYETQLDLGEDISVEYFSLEEVNNLIKNGKITHALVIIAFYWFNQLKNNNK